MLTRQEILIITNLYHSTCFWLMELLSVGEVTMCSLVYCRIYGTGKSNTRGNLHGWDNWVQFVGIIYKYNCRQLVSDMYGQEPTIPWKHIDIKYYFIYDIVQLKYCRMLTCSLNSRVAKQVYVDILDKSTKFFHTLFMTLTSNFW